MVILAKKIAVITGFKIRNTFHAISCTAFFGTVAAQPADDLTTTLRNAETRAAIAASERAELLARLPPTSKPLNSMVEPLQQAMDTHAPQGSKAHLMLPVLNAVPATLRAATDCRRCSRPTPAPMPPRATRKRNWRRRRRPAASGSRA